jgi:hypothetical protein
MVDGGSSSMGAHRQGGSSWRGAPVDPPSEGRRALADPPPATGPTSTAGDAPPAPTTSATGLRLASAIGLRLASASPPPPTAGGRLRLRQTKHGLRIFAKSWAPLGCSVNLDTLMYLVYTIHTYAISQVFL